MSNILFVSSEVFPLIKTGGLADVAGSLPPALQKLAQDVRLLLPAYPAVLEKLKSRKSLVSIKHHGIEAELLETRLPGSRLPVYLIDCPELYNRTGGPYVDEHGQAWHDNAMRFAYLCYSAVDIATDQLSLGWVPELVHCNDWQTGLIPALLSLQSKRPATVFTIHNMAYQGNFDYQTFQHLKLPNELWHMNGLEFYGQFSFLKGGLAFADKINAVSPSYAREIMTPANGYGLDGLLRHRAKDVHGILNGIDTRHWNPGTDELISQKYNRRSLEKKVINKLSLQKKLGLPEDDRIPMFGMISRLVQQKGLDWILQILPELVKLPAQFVFLGTGEASYEKQLSKLANKYPDKVQVTIGYDEVLSHQIEAASDMYLMPSLFEPCGLNQLYSLRYGTLPIVNRVGGLADSVVDTNAKTIADHSATGFILPEASSSSLYETIARAIGCYNDQQQWHQLRQNAMNCDFSWQSSAEQYLALYSSALEQRNST